MPSTCQLKLLAGVAVSKVADELSSTSVKIAACDCERKASLNNASKTQSSARAMDAEKNRDVLVIRPAQKEVVPDSTAQSSRYRKNYKNGGEFPPFSHRGCDLPR